MKIMVKPVLAGFFLAALSGTAIAQPGPATRACLQGEELVGGVCRPLTRAPDNRGSTPSPGNTTSAPTGPVGGSPGGVDTTGSTGGGSGGTGNTPSTGGTGGQRGNTGSGG